MYFSHCTEFSHIIEPQKSDRRIEALFRAVASGDVQNKALRFSFVMHECGFDPGRRGRSGEAKRVRPHPNPTRSLIISYPPKGSILTPSDASRRADRISRGLPCYCELASLLSRIDSLFRLLREF